MRDIALSNFASYFGFFAALNLGYATSQTFRDAINGRFFQLRKTEKSLLQDIQGLRANLVSISGSPKLNDRVNKFENAFNEGIYNINRDRRLASMFVRGFKCMFLITTLFSITLMIVCGFISQEAKNYNYCIYNLLHCLNALILLFNLVMFARSFTKFSPLNVRPEITTFLFLAVVVIVVYFNSNYEQSAKKLSEIITLQQCVSVSIFVALSPYVIHFLRAFIHKVFYYGYEYIFVKWKAWELKALKKYMSDIKEDFGNILP